MSIYSNLPFLLTGRMRERLTEEGKEDIEELALLRGDCVVLLRTEASGRLRVINRVGAVASVPANLVQMTRTGVEGMANVSSADAAAQLGDESHRGEALAFAARERLFVLATPQEDELVCVNERGEVGRVARSVFVERASSAQQSVAPNNKEVQLHYGVFVERQGRVEGTLTTSSDTLVSEVLSDILRTGKVRIEKVAKTCALYCSDTKEFLQPYRPLKRCKIPPSAHVKCFDFRRFMTQTDVPVLVPPPQLRRREPALTSPPAVELRSARSVPSGLQSNIHTANDNDDNDDADNDDEANDDGTTGTGKPIRAALRRQAKSSSLTSTEGRSSANAPQVSSGPLPSLNVGDSGLRAWKKSDSGRPRTLAEYADSYRATRRTMDQQDWTELFKDCESVSLCADTIIVQEGHANNCLFYVMSGSVHAMLGSMRLCELASGSFFGELSLIDNSSLATASVVAGANGVVVRQLKRDTLRERLIAEPQLGLRLMGTIVTRLGSMLYDLPLASVLKAQAQKPRSRAPAQLLEKLQRRFHLSETETIMKEYECDYAKKVNYHGALFVTNRHCCFGGKVFGSERTVKISLYSVESLSVEHQQLTVNAHRKTHVFRLRSPEEAKECHTLLRREVETQQKDADGDAGGAAAVNMDESTTHRGRLFDVEQQKQFTDLFATHTVKQIKKGHTVAAQGDMNNTLYQVLSGTCRLERVDEGLGNRSRVVGKTEPGELFGELDYIGRGGAEASLIAETDVEVVLVDFAAIADRFEADKLTELTFVHSLACGLRAKIVRAEQELMSAVQLKAMKPRFYRVALYEREVPVAEEFVYRVMPQYMLGPFQNFLRRTWSGGQQQANLLTFLTHNRDVDTATLDDGKIFVQVSAVKRLGGAEFQSEAGVVQGAGDDDIANIRRRLVTYCVDTDFGREASAADAAAPNGDEAQSGAQSTFLRVRVTDRRETELTPLQSSLETMRARCVQLREELEYSPPRINSLQQVLQGSVVPMVNVGPVRICEVFLAPQLSGKHDAKLLAELAAVMREFLQLCQEALELNGSVITEKFHKFQAMLEKMYTEMREKMEKYVRIDPSRVAPSPSLQGAHGVLQLHVVRNDADSVQRLLANAPDIAINACDSLGNTVLHMACRDASAPVMLRLMEHARIDVDACNRHGNTPLHILCMKFRTADFEPVLARMKELNADLDAANNLGETPLHKCAMNGAHGDALARWLLQNGASVDAPNNLGETPMHYAIYVKQEKMLKTLLDADDVDVQVAANDGATAIDLALEAGGELCDLVRAHCERVGIEWPAQREQQLNEQRKQQQQQLDPNVVQLAFAAKPRRQAPRRNTGVNNKK